MNSSTRWFPRCANEVSSGIRQYQPHMYNCNVNPDYILYAFPGRAVQLPFPPLERPLQFRALLIGARVAADTHRLSQHSLRFPSLWKGFGCIGECSCSCLVADVHTSSIPFEIVFVIVIHGLSNLVLANVCQETINDPLCINAYMSIGSSRVAFEFRLIMHVARFPTHARWFPSTSGHADILDVSHSQTTLYSYWLVLCAWSPRLPRHKLITNAEGISLMTPID